MVHLLETDPPPPSSRGVTIVKKVRALGPFRWGAAVGDAAVWTVFFARGVKILG